jgi:outer membrane protein TolC
MLIEKLEELALTCGHRHVGWPQYNRQRCLDCGGTRFYDLQREIRGEWISPERPNSDAQLQTATTVSGKQVAVSNIRTVCGSIYTAAGRPVKRALLLAIAILLCCVVPMSGQSLRGQPQQATDDAQAPLLTLDDAVSLALENNRLVKNSSLEARKFDFRVDTARSRRLPQFQFAVLGGELLQPFNFNVPAGSLGTYPSTGPVPSTNSKIHTPAQFVTYTTAAFDQPVSQQYKIHLGIHATELARDIAKEDVRAERQKIASEVRNAYFNLVATQAGVDATREAVKTLEEAQRVTAKYQAEQTVLRTDVLEVDARLAKAHYDLSVAENGLATQREHLNQLLGRDLATSFRADFMPETEAEDLTLQVARDRAEKSRPEIRQAQFKQKQAEYDRRIAKAEYIPDLSVSVRYLGMNNVSFVPGNVSVAGFFLSWEPFDWGRRRNAVSEKKKTVEQARNGVAETQSQVAVEVGMKYRKWHEDALLLKVARTQQDANTERLRVVSTKYKEQAALIKDLLEAQARKSESDYQYQQALSSYWGALAELRRAMGEE